MEEIKIPRNQYRVSITSACNMKCLYCHNEGNLKNKIMSIEQLENIIKHSLKYGLEEVRLTGGDPLTHPDLIDIVKMIKDKYGLSVGINTNLVLFEKLLLLCQNNYINRVVVGIDYFDKPISKNSPIGVPSSLILNRILELKKYVDNISIDVVYSGNEEDILNLVKFGIDNVVRVKVIEIEKNEIANEPQKKYQEICEKILVDNKLYSKIDDIGEINGYKDGKMVVSFLHSLCRLRRCNICKDIQLRIGCDGIARPCIFYDNQNVDLLSDDIEKSVVKVLTRKVDYHYDIGLVK